MRPSMKPTCLTFFIPFICTYIYRVSDLVTEVAIENLKDKMKFKNAYFLFRFEKKEP